MDLRVLQGAVRCGLVWQVWRYYWAFCSMAVMLSSKEPVMVKFSSLKRRLFSTSGDVLHKCRSTSRWIHELGEYYTTCSSSGGVTGKHIDLKELEEDLAKEKSFA